MSANVVHAKGAIGERAPFSGSYAAEDVVFLLERISGQALDPGSLAEKERLIQSGRRHYSEMLSEETAPSAAYMDAYRDGMRRHRDRLARDIARLVRGLDASIDGQITLVSLVRAGVPPGVLVTRGLKRRGRDVAHFGVSIIRDRGIDANALGYVLARRKAGGVVFVDGWTGKGAISDELARDLPRAAPGVAARLLVIADPGGRAWMSASFDDWLIPCGILGANVSGLISRSVLTDDLIRRQGFHGAAVAGHLRSVDVSRNFADDMDAAIAPLLAASRDAADVAPAVADDATARARVRAAAEAAIDAVTAEFGVSNRNRIKPGIAEATRAVLRRAPDRILVRDADDPDLAGLLTLARDRGVTVEPRGVGLGPYRAITLIMDASDISPRHPE